MQEFRPFHVLDCSPVGVLGLHRQLYRNDHVTGARSSQIPSILQQLCCRVQVEECLVTEVGLGARMANKEDLGHRVESLEQVIVLLVTVPVASHQVYLQFDVVVVLFFGCTEALILLTFRLPLLYVFYIEANSLTQL